MADLVFNSSKGKVAYYASLPGANDALVAVVLEATGLEADATLKDYDTLAALLAGASNEQTTLGRKTLAGTSVTPDDTNDWQSADFDDPVWAGSAGNPTGAIVVCYDPDTTVGTDADLIPLTKHDWTVTPDGSTITATVNASGFYRAT